MSKSYTTFADDLALPSAVTAPLPADFRLTAATAGDHLEIHRLLRQVTQQPSEDDFQSQLDEPTYEPTDRLLIKHGARIVAHLRIVRREMAYESAIVPVACFADVVTLPEYRRRGCATALLAAAEHVAAADGAVLGLLRSHLLDFYRQYGWHDGGRRSATVASPLHLLSRLRETEPKHLLADEPAPPRLHIRFWRHVEQAALVRLYEAAAVGKIGWWMRTASGWRWLVSRRGFDRLYIAIEGSPRPELDDSFDSIVAYACEREGRIAELICSPSRPDAQRQLLARICRDALERDLHTIVLDAPGDDELHREFIAAGGWKIRPAEDPYGMLAKVLDASGFVQQIRPAICQRVAQSEHAPEVSLGVASGGQTYLLEATSRTAKLEPARLMGRNYLSCSDAQFLHLLLGRIDIPEAVKKGELECSTGVACRIAAAIFPRRPLWFPPLEDMPAK